MPIRARTRLKARCGDCGLEFGSPGCSDFEYGSAMFHGELGTVHAILESIGHPVFDLLVDVRNREFPGIEKYGELVFNACAHFADRVAGQDLRDVPAVCPRCFSSRPADWGGEEMGSIDVPAATFARFEALPEKRRRWLAARYFEAKVACGLNSIP